MNKLQELNAKTSILLGKTTAGAIYANMYAEVHIGGTTSFYHNSAVHGGEQSHDTYYRVRSEKRENATADFIYSACIR